MHVTSCDVIILAYGAGPDNAPDPFSCSVMADMFLVTSTAIFSSKLNTTQLYYGYGVQKCACMSPCVVVFLSCSVCVWYAFYVRLCMYVGWLNHMTVSRCKHISYC